MPNLPKKKRKTFIRKRSTARTKTKAKKTIALGKGAAYSVKKEPSYLEINSFGIQPEHILPDFFNLENLVRFATLFYVLALLPIFVSTSPGYNRKSTYSSAIRQRSSKDVVTQRQVEPTMAGSNNRSSKLSTVLGETVSQLPIPGYPNWRVSYYNNRGFGGDPIVETIESYDGLDFDWGLGSPHVSINEDNFSIVWETRMLIEKEGFYTFSASSDDGVRVYVDNSKIIHQEPSAGEQSSETIFLSRGAHTIEVAYYENTGDAKIKMHIK